MAKENLIGIKAKNCLNPSILKQSGCATGNNTTLASSSTGSRRYFQLRPPEFKSSAQAIRSRFTTLI